MSKVPDPKHHDRMGPPIVPVSGVPGIKHHLKLYANGQLKVECKGRGYTVSPIDFEAWLEEQFLKGKIAKHGTPNT